MSLDFMKPDIWDGLVFAVTLVGVAFAILRLMNDYSVYQRRRQRLDLLNEQQPTELDGE